jgi:hypothetical protein
VKLKLLEFKKFKLKSKYLKTGSIEPQNPLSRLKEFLVFSLSPARHVTLSWEPSDWLIHSFLSSFKNHWQRSHRTSSQEARRKRKSGRERVTMAAGYCGFLLCFEITTTGSGRAFGSAAGAVM